VKIKGYLKEGQDKVKKIREWEN